MSRKEINQNRIKLISRQMRPHVQAILDDLEAAGWQPVIDSQVYRTPAEQAALKRKGVSTVSYGYHNVTDPNNTPASMAADIVDIRYGWAPTKDYWLYLAIAAENQNLETGIYWGLSQAARKNIKSLIDSRNTAGNYSMGWDPAHVQPPQSLFTPAKASSGARYSPGNVRELVFASPIANYKLLSSTGEFMQYLKAQEGTAWVRARDWEQWMGAVVDFVNGHVIMNGREMVTRVESGVGFVPIRQAAEVTGLDLYVDNANRTISLRRP